MSKGVSISVIILTYNEEANIEYALKSIYGWASEIFIVDSYSTDRTLEIARKYTNKIYQHPFENFAQQRNWALTLPISNEWVFYLDADEMVTDDLKEELGLLFANGIPDDIRVLAIRQFFFFLGKRLRFSYQNSLELRILRKDKVFWEFRGNEWLRFEGKMKMLKSRVIHWDRRGLHTWIAKENKYSTANAQYLYNSRGRTNRWEGRELGRKIKYKLYHKLPLFVRPFFYFSYRYFMKLGFLDGIPGFVYAFLMYFWHNFLIDAKYYEMLKSSQEIGT